MKQTSIMHCESAFSLEVLKIDSLVRARSRSSDFIITGDPCFEHNALSWSNDL